ncbi:MAG: putative signal transducing protein [Flavobacteriales bacterium]|jgi:hypothetical protein
MKGWVVIYSDGLLAAVELRRVVLEEQDIPAIVLNKRDSSYLFGFLELLVREEDAEIAMELIRPTNDLE